MVYLTRSGPACAQTGTAEMAHAKALFKKFKARIKKSAESAKFQTLFSTSDSCLCISFTINVVTHRLRNSFWISLLVCTCMCVEKTVNMRVSDCTLASIPLQHTHESGFCYFLACVTKSVLKPDADILHVTA
jgi:hypothetical protein